MVLLIKIELLLYLRNACTEDESLQAFSVECDIALSSSERLPEDVLVVGCGCLTAIWKESWQHRVEGISQTEESWLPSQLVNTVASLLD